MKKHISTLLCAAALASAAADSVLAEDIQTIFKKVEELSASENYPKAIEELGWAKKELEKKHLAKLQTMLPEQIAGYKGQKVKSSSAIGFTSVERDYKKGSERIKLTITGGAIGAGAGAGGLAALGRIGAMMGNQPGTDTFRLNGKTANLKVQNKRAEVSVFLESGAILKLEQRKVEDDGKELRTAAENLPVTEIDNYLKGNGGKS